MFGIWTPGPTEIVIILVIALLLFGKRLPEVGRSLGRGIVEFKKGIKGIEDQIDDASDAPPPRTLPGAADYRPEEEQKTKTTGE